MKRFLSALLFCGLVLLFSQCVIDRKTLVGSAQLEKREFPVSGFHRISLSSLFQAEVYPSENYRVEVECNSNLVDLLIVEQKDDALVLALRPDYQFKDVTVRAVVYMPQLIGIQGSGVTRAYLHDIRTSGFSGSLSGISKLEGNLQVEDALQLNASGASSVFLESRAASAKVSLSGTSKYDGVLNVEGSVEMDASGASSFVVKGRSETGRISLSGASKFSGSSFLFVRSADVGASGASSVTLCTNGEISADLSGASSLYYYGDAVVVKKETSGASSVKRLGEMPQ